MAEGPIGVFDSGVGGLTVVREILSRAPSEAILYFGDTARVPYGNKSPETVVRYSLEIANFLKGKGVRHLVVACNTSSSVALPDLQRRLSIPVLGMIEPGARAAVEATRNGRIGLIGTRATVQSGAYVKAAERLDPAVKVFSAACPLFVPLVEEGWGEDPVAREVAVRYLEPLLAEGIDTLILGCTHYPVLIPVLREVAGEGVRLISSAAAAADALAPYLREGKTGGFTCFVTDPGTHFREVGERILGRAIPELVAVPEERLRNP